MKIKVVVDGKELILDNVKTITQSMGEMIGVDLRRCKEGNLCPTCISRGRTKPCRLSYFNKYIKTSGDLPEITLDTGEQFFIESWEKL